MYCECIVSIYWRGSVRLRDNVRKRACLLAVHVGPRYRVWHHQNAIPPYGSLSAYDDRVTIGPKDHDNYQCPKYDLANGDDDDDEDDDDEDDNVYRQRSSVTLNSTGHY